MGNYKIVLASESPRRIELMRKVLPEVEIISPDVDERIQKDDMSPEELVLSIAEKKAMNIRDKVDRGIIVTADTIVMLGDKIFGKPHTEEEATRMIYELQGREHSVYTGVVIVKIPDNIVRKFVERSVVKIKAMNDDEVTTYIKHAKWQDKAGAYGIQETPDIVEYYHGDYYNIVGLPVDKTVELIHKVRDTHVLKAMDVALPEGRGVAKKDRLVVFVRGMLGGDVGEVHVIRKRRSYSEGVLELLLKPSEHRVSPVCRHFGTCGGCNLQSCDYFEQLRYKEKWVHDNFMKFLHRDPPIHKIEMAPRIWYYRNKMEFTFRPSGDNGLKLGLHRQGSYREVVDIEECPIFSQYIGEVLNFIRGYAKKSGLPAYDPDTHEGFWRYVVVRRSRSNNDMLVNIVTKYEDMDIVNKLADELMARFGFIRGVLWTLSSGMSEAVVAERVELLQGEEYLEEHIGTRKYRFGVFSFVQANLQVTELLYNKLRSYLEPTDVVLDLYTGVGSIAIYIADKVKSVTGVELMADCIRWAEVNVQLNNVRNTMFIQSDVKHILRQYSDMKGVITTVIIDPPRGGTSKKIVERIVRLEPTKILYMSCQPATLVRDLAWFEERGYVTAEVWPFDMFPHTGHVESLAILLPKKRND